MARICSPYPGIMRLQTASVASGVTSLGAGPVPPVVTIRQQPWLSACGRGQRGETDQSQGAAPILQQCRTVGCLEVGASNHCHDAKFWMVRKGATDGMHGKLWPCNAVISAVLCCMAVHAVNGPFLPDLSVLPQ